MKGGWGSSEDGQRRDVGYGGNIVVVVVEGIRVCVVGSRWRIEVVIGFSVAGGVDDDSRGLLLVLLSIVHVSY